MRKWIAAVALLALIVPSAASANRARTIALAGGDARLLPDDSNTAEVFPGRIHEHQRITFENVNPETGASDRENRQRWGGFTAEVERFGGTIGWFVNRPHSARRHQLSSQSRFDQDFGKTAHSEVSPASDIIDLFWGNESWGLTAALGSSSEEFPDTTTSDPDDSETFRNMTVDVVLGKNLASGTEVSANFFMSRFGELDGDNQDPNAFGLGVNLRHPTEWEFFNHIVASASFLKDLQFTNNDDFDGRTAFMVDANLLNFTSPGDGEPIGGPMAGDLTYLLAIGAGVTSVKEEGMDVDRVNRFTLPKATAGAELGIASWLTVRGSATHSFNIDTGGDFDASGGSGVSTTLGAGLHWDRLTVDMVINNNLLTDGPNFVGGLTPGVSRFVTVDWAL
jgi:hypothetical protein